LINRLKIAIAAGAAAFILVAPAYAFAASETYNTTFVPYFPTVSGPNWYGSLTLNVGNGGIVQGWYHPQYGGIIPVSGSVKNGAYWLQIGMNGNFEIYATMQPNGTLTGTASQTGALGGAYPPTFDFAAAPTTAKG
jgi:hypothetical protein